jgi:TonB family protein
VTFHSQDGKILAMQKLDAAIRSTLSALLPMAFIFLGLAASGQTPPSPTAAPPPASTKDLMLLAARTSNLTSEGAKPWHIKVSYTMYEEDGSIKDQGLIEEYWASPDQYKLMTTGKDFTQTVYKTQDGQFRSGKQETLLAMYHDAVAQVTEPIPSTEAIDRTNFTVQEQANGTAKLSCVEPSNSNSGLLAAYCLAGVPPIARIVVYNGQNSFQAMRNRIQPYQDRFVAGDVIFRKLGKTLLTAHLESIEPLASVDEALFTPSDDAVLLSFSSKTPVQLIDRKPPEYPRIARDAHVQGTVILEAHIGKDGKPVGVRLIGGPAMLQSAALDAVKEWKYRPYLVHGKPVEFIVNVAFTFNGNGFVDSNRAQQTAPEPRSPYGCSLTGTGCGMTTSTSGNMITITPR